MSMQGNVLSVPSDLLWSFVYCQIVWMAVTEFVFRQFSFPCAFLQSRNPVYLLLVFKIFIVANELKSLMSDWHCCKRRHTICHVVHTTKFRIIISLPLREYDLILVRISSMI